MEKPTARIESHKLLNTLKRVNKVTIRQLSERMGITLKRIRFVLANGIENHYALRDWIQAIEGVDPGTVESWPIVYRNPRITETSWRLSK